MTDTACHSLASSILSTSLHSPDPANLRGPEVSCGGSEAGSSVPPAVIRSLRNIRREVVVDLEGRNVLR